MSHKIWFSVFNDAEKKWETIGRKEDDESEMNGLSFGPFKTKRASEYTSRFGKLMASSIKEVEVLAKLSEQMPERKEVVVAIEAKDVTAKVEEIVGKKDEGEKKKEVPPCKHCPPSYVDDNGDIVFGPFKEVKSLDDLNEFEMLTGNENYHYTVGLAGSFNADQLLS